MSSRRIAVAMSGGVDSSVAASLLVGQGEDVFGVMLRLWTDTEGANRCCSPEDMTSARQVAQQLGIPLYVLDARDFFRDRVVAYFLDGYAHGTTPNPCLECNRLVRWGFLLQQALALGATHLATGHYARTELLGHRYRLLRARDRHKDQSYFLSVLDQHQLAHALFPLGNLAKPHVRLIADRLNLPVARRRESQDLCFVPDGDYRSFLRKHSPTPIRPGPILNLAGHRLGTHSGLADFTIGQRKGLRLATGHPLYVLEKRPETNTLVVGPRESLARTSFRAGSAHWIEGEPPSTQFEALVRVRYKATEVLASVHLTAVDEVIVTTAEAIADVTPGQAAVFYQGDVCLGSARILP